MEYKVRTFFNGIRKHFLSVIYDFFFKILFFLDKQKSSFFRRKLYFSCLNLKKSRCGCLLMATSSLNSYLFFLLLKIKRCFENVILLTWIRPGSGLIKFCGSGSGSGYDQSESTSLDHSFGNKLQWTLPPVHKHLTLYIINCQNFVAPSQKFSSCPPEYSIPCLLRQAV